MAIGHPDPATPLGIGPSASRGESGRGVKANGYAAATAVAPAVRAHFDHAIGEARVRGEVHLPEIPGEAAITQIIDAAFWASLRREEGYAPRISLAYVRPADTIRPLMFASEVPLEPGALTRIAPAVERPGIHLGVHERAGSLSVWGIARSIPKYCLVVEVAEPGLLVVKHHRGEIQAKFVNVAVLQGDQVKVVDEHASTLPDCPSLLTSLLGFDAPGTWAGAVNVTVQLAVSMRAHRRGGLLLVVPAGTESWRESIVHPVTYAVSPAYSELAALGRGPAEGASARAWREELARAVDALAGLTAIDGATILNSDYELLAFGAKVVRRKGSTTVEHLMLTEPIMEVEATTVSPSQLGGTRHLAAAQFVHDQHDTLALVASQDGRFTVIAYSPGESMVHAHRVETLLL